MARRHGHVFWMAWHNEGDWRMETWQRARRASCLVSIRQFPGQNTLMFALVFRFELRARAARTCFHCHLAVKTRFMTTVGVSQNCQKVTNGNTMWSCDIEFCTHGVEASKGCIFIAHFSIYSTSRCRCHVGADECEHLRYNSTAVHVNSH